MLYINTLDVYDNDDGVIDDEDGYEWRRVVMTANICSVRQFNKHDKKQKKKRGISWKKNFK